MPALFSDYEFPDFPDLSAQRKAPDERGQTFISIDLPCTEEILLVATARCLGRYCQSDDILLGWQPHQASDPTRILATRVRWAEARNWTDILESGIEQKEVQISQESLPQAFEQDSKFGRRIFLAVITQNTSYNHPLVLTLSEANDTGETNYGLFINFSLQMLHSSAAEILAKQLKETCESIISRPDNNHNALSFLSPALKSFVPVNTSSATYSHLPRCSTVVDYMREHDPTSTALEFYPDLNHDSQDSLVERLSYGELDVLTNKFAWYLLDQGIKRQDRIAICMQRDVNFHVCMLGILKAGGCYVPIEPELPEERQSFIVRDSDARILLTQENISDHMREAQCMPDRYINEARGDELAYLLYTSGTTGTPKGCLLSHDGFAQAILALSWFSYQAARKKRYLAVASIAFDVHLAETFVAWSLGMTLIAAPRTQLFEDLPHWLHRLQITHVGIVPSLIEATMVAVDNSADGGRDKSMDLAYIASGGDKMSDIILDRWADHSSIMLANFYGPTEVTIGCSARFMTSKTRRENIGHIFRNCSAYVVDNKLDLVPRGCAGELLVGGRLVGIGYHKRQDLTDKAFIEWNGERVYRTGDLVRLMPDDTLEILGRIDTQIKLRGVRIEADGISSVIREAANAFPDFSYFPDVSTVLTKHPSLKADLLVSFISCERDASITQRRTEKPKILTTTPRGLLEELERACVRELASYMRPAYIVPMDFLPLNSSGKIANNLLISLFQGENLDVIRKARTQDTSANSMTRTASRELSNEESQIAKVIADLIETTPNRLSPFSNLFELGLDSTKLVQLTSRLRKAFPKSQKSLAVGDLICNPSLEGIAVLIGSPRSMKMNDGRQSSIIKFSQKWGPKVEETYGMGMIENIYPTFPIQDGVLYRSTDLDTLYIQHVIMEIKDDVDIERLKSAWETVRRTHEILRTVFYFSNEIVQVVLKPDACTLSWNDCTLPEDTVPPFSSYFLEDLAEGISRDINENVSARPPFSLNCYSGRQGSACKTRLALSIHHSIYDGTTLPLLLRDVERVYQNSCTPSSVALGDVLEVLYDVDHEEAKSYWVDLFNDFDWSKMPNRQASGQFASTCSLVLEEYSLQGWTDMSRKIKSSLQAIFTAAFGISLGSHVYGRQDVVFGTIRSGRTFSQEDLNISQAPLLYVSPTRVRFRKDQDLLETIQREIGNSLVWGHIPLGKIQQWVRPSQNLFEVLFSVSTHQNEMFDLWNIESSSQPHADFILAVEIVLDHTIGKIRIDCAYTDPFSHDTITSLLSDTGKVAAELLQGVAPILISQPSTPVSIDSDETKVNATEFIDDSRPPDKVKERRICDIVSRFLEIDQEMISPTTSLMSLGLDSIKSIGLSRILKREGFQVSALEVMQQPTIRRIFARSSEKQESSSGDREKEMEILLKEDVEKIEANCDKTKLKLGEDDVVVLHPVTSLQAGMLSQTVSSRGSLYVHAFPYILSKEVDFAILQEAWICTLKYFELLRTSFHFVATLGCWVQASHSICYPNWTETAKHMHDSVGVDVEKFISYLNFSTESSFDKPPVHARLYRDWSGKSSSVLVIILHHAIYDGISIDILNDVFKTFYRGGRPNPSLQFKDMLSYFKYQEKHGSSFWIERLKGYSKPRIESDLNGVPQSFSTSCEIPVSASVLENACKQFEVTAQCFGQAAVAKLLARTYQSEDVLFGHVVSGRNVSSAEEVFGPLISTLPFRVKIAREQSNLELVRMIQAQNVESLDWQHSSLRSIQRKLGLSSLWDCIYAFQPLHTNKMDDVNLWNFDVTEEEVVKIQYPLNIEVHQREDSLLVKAACQSSCFSETGLHDALLRLASDFIMIIEEPEQSCLPGDPFNNASKEEIVLPQQESDCEKQRLGSLDNHLQTIIDIIAAVVEVQPDSIHSSTLLRSLGVDSIAAIHISAKARQSGLNIPSADIVSCQRISDLLRNNVSIINKVHSTPHTPSSLQTVRRDLSRLSDDYLVDKDIEEVFPVSGGMEWLIGMWRLSNGYRFQHVFAFAIQEGISDLQIASAWEALVKSHKILRSSFYCTEDGDLHVAVFKKLPDDRAWTDIELGSHEGNDEIILKFATDLVSKPLSPIAPPIKPYLVHCHGKSFFILHIHHFQYDAWSLRLLVDNLQVLCTQGRYTEIDTDLGNTLLRLNNPGYRGEQERYWRTYLAEPFIPSLIPRKKGTSNGQSERLIYLRETVKSIKQLRQKARKLSLSLNAVFLACWAKVQAVHCDEASATFGLWHHGRASGSDENLNISDLALPCMNILPIHVKIGKEPILDLSRQLQRTLMERSVAVQRSHLRDISQWTSSRDQDSRILLNVYVNILEVDEHVEIPSPVLQPVHIPYGVSNSTQELSSSFFSGRPAICDIIQDAVMVEFAIGKDGMTASIEYDSGFLDESICHNMIDSWSTLVTSLLEV